MVNLCALYSNLLNHHGAIQCAKHAIIIALEYISEEKKEEGCHDSDRLFGGDIIAVLYMAYYNLAVEHEYVGQRAVAIKYFEKAKNISSFRQEKNTKPSLQFSLLCDRAIGKLRNIVSCANSDRQLWSRANTRQCSMKQMKYGSKKALYSKSKTEMMSSRQLITKSSKERKQSMYSLACYKFTM